MLGSVWSVGDCGDWGAGEDGCPVVRSTTTEGFAEGADMAGDFKFATNGELLGEAAFVIASPTIDRKVLETLDAASNSRIGNEQRCAKGA